MKCFFSDIDGTLLQNHKIDKDTVKKIKSFIEDGNKFILATGRIDADIKALEKSLGFFGDYRISQNGAVIKDKNDNIVYKKLLPKNIIEKLSEYVYSLENVTIEVTEVDKRYATAKRQISYVYEFTEPVIIDPKLKEKIPNLECTLFLILSDNEGQFQGFSKYIKDNFEGIYAVQTSPGCLEVISNEVSKGNAIVYLQDILKIKPEDVVVAGDNYNDISMFKIFENSFAMEMAPNDVKSYAKNVAKNVAEVIEMVNFKQK